MPKNFKTLKLYKTILKRILKLGWVEILGIAFFFGILVFATFFFTRQKVAINITLRLLASNGPQTDYNFPRQLFLENLKEGLKAKDQLGNTVIEILDIYRYPSSNVNQDVYTTLRLSTVYDRRTGQYTFESLPLLVGDYRTFHLQGVSFNGIIIDINTTGKPHEQKKFLITGFLDPNFNNGIPIDKQVILSNDSMNANGVMNYMADQVKPGLKIFDNQGLVIVEIVSVNKTPGKISSVENGRYIATEDPDTKHVEINMVVSAEKIGDGYYFEKEAPIIVGGQLILTFDKLKIHPTISSIKEIN